MGQEGWGTRSRTFRALLVPLPHAPCPSDVEREHTRPWLMTTTHDLIVLGGGAAGLTAAGIAVNLGASVAMVERARLGGDCTWTGCIPSKTLLHAAAVAQQSATASRVGLTDTEIPVDFGRLMAHVRTVREEVYEDADAPPLFEDMGIDVVAGDARFISERTVEVTADDGTTRRLSGRKIIVATGGRPAVPPIDGLDGVPFLTSETLFEITDQPEHLVVLGGGSIGVEMAQAFRRLGSRVTVVERGDRILERAEPEPALALQQVLADEGVAFRLGSDAVRAEKTDAGIVLTVKSAAGEAQITGDALLVAVGRKPNVESLGLGAAGVATTRKGITVDDRCRTNVAHIFAAGDVTGRYALTHMSEHMAKIAVMNAVVHLPSGIDTGHVPWATFTTPELAHVGPTAAELDAAGTRYTTFRFPYTKLDRAITEGETTGDIQIHATRFGKILGASILGARAGDLIGEVAVAMKAGVSLMSLSSTIHPYPSYGLGVRRAADQWAASLQTKTAIRALRFVFRLRGPVNAHEPGRIV